MEHYLAKEASEKASDEEDKEVAEMRRKLQAAKLVCHRIPMATVLIARETEVLCVANLI